MGEQIGADTLKEIMRDPYFIPAGYPTAHPVAEFQEQKDRMALVVDEYGELKGLLTLEDILEESSAEFTTHSRCRQLRFRRMEDAASSWKGGVCCGPEPQVGLRFPLGGPKTLNGLILEHLQDIPGRGRAQIGGIPAEVLQTRTG